MEYLTLKNGVQIPQIGFGVFQIPAKQTKQAVLAALRAGYRLIDTAQSYMNQKAVGEAFRESGVAREEIFLTTKIWMSNASYEKAKSSINNVRKFVPPRGSVRCITITEKQFDAMEILLGGVSFNEEMNAQKKSHAFWL